MLFDGNVRTKDAKLIIELLKKRVQVAQQKNFQHILDIMEGEDPATIIFSTTSGKVPAKIQKQGQYFLIKLDSTSNAVVYRVHQNLILGKPS